MGNDKILTVKERLAQLEVYSKVAKQERVEIKNGINNLGTNLKEGMNQLNLKFDAHILSNGISRSNKKDKGIWSIISASVTFGLLTATYFLTRTLGVAP
jgi:hypothetical protein|tara:strand:- start:7597 stop:7893 length:297 start_codon:yes stop_codon:yes gene_type:complete